MSDTWTSADIQRSTKQRRTFSIGGNRRSQGGTLSRFQGTAKAHGAIGGRR